MRVLNSMSIVPLSDFVPVDPDFLKKFLPEWQGYVKHDHTRAGTLTR
jgi:hypothetical protein